MGYKIKGSHLKLTSLLLLLLTGCVDGKYVADEVSADEYVIICGYYKTLQKEVNEWLKEGYMVSGGLGCTDRNCCQALLRIEDDNKDDSQWLNPLSTNEANP